MDIFKKSGGKRTPKVGERRPKNGKEKKESVKRFAFKFFVVIIVASLLSECDGLHSLPPVLQVGK